LRRAWKSSHLPASVAKRAAARKGKRLSAKHRKAIGRGQKGRVVTLETREKMSAAHKRRGSRGPLVYPHWTVAEEALLDTLKPKDVAARTGRTIDAVYTHRRLLRLGLVEPGLGG
jgi:hypothetical protein